MSDGAGLGNLLLLLLPILLLVWLFFSQRRRARDVADFQSGLTVGQEVITTSGMFGRIEGLTDRTVRLRIADGVVVTFDRRAIGMPVPAAGADGEAAPR